jgi:hypothetical protein
MTIEPPRAARVAAGAHVVASVALVLAHGCGGTLGPPWARPAARGAGLPSGAALLEQAASQRRRVGPLVATFDARIQRRESWLAATSLAGVLAVVPPDHLRVRLFLPAGPAAQDLTVAGERYRLVLPLEGREERGATCSPYEPGCDTGNPGLLLAWLFTHEPSCAAERCTVKRHRDRYEVTSALAPGRRLVAIVSIAEGNPTMVAEEIQRNGHPSIRIEYSDHRLVAGVRTPYRIQFADEGRGIRIALDINTYRPSPALPADTFEVN